MKKLFLLLSMSSIGLAANAQFVSRNASPVMPNLKKTVDLSGPVSLTHKQAARTTATAFYTQAFAGSLPGTWSTGVISGPGTWHYTTVASTSAYHLAALASTTAANGWMIFDSDSLGTVGGATPAGYLQSEAINCAAHTTVRLTFQELYRKFNDSCFVWVSTSPTFATHTAYAVTANNSLAGNVSTANPQTVHINISATAASQPAVYIRFVYYGAGGGSYSWNIDDISISELDPHDVDIHKSFAWNPQATAYSSSIFATPLAFVDSIYPVVLASNQGANAENPSVNAQIFNGTTSVYTQTQSYALPVGAQDSIIQYGGYKPTAIGTYTMPFSATATGDADMTNNVDTTFFAVTDTTWMVNSGSISTAYYLHRATPALSYMNGARFDVPTSSTGDTVSGFGVAFSSSSVPTGAGQVAVQLYSAQQSSTNWTYVGTSVVKAVTAGDISTSSSTVWAYFPIDAAASGGISQFILAPGTTYAAVVQTKNVTTDLLILASSVPNATPFAGYFGQSDSSLNDGGNATFGASSVATGLTSVPLVRMYFGPRSTVGVNDVNASAIATEATPNPATSEVKISFTQATAANTVINIVNTLGQVVATQTVSASTNGSATFNTANLASGVYYYTVNSNGGRATGRVVVAH